MPYENGTAANDDWYSNDNNLFALPRKDYAPTAETIQRTIVTSIQHRYEITRSQLRGIIEDLEQPQHTTTSNRKRTFEDFHYDEFNDQQDDDDENTEEKKKEDEKITDDDDNDNDNDNSIYDDVVKGATNLLRSSEDDNDMFWFNDLRKKLHYARLRRRMREKLDQIHTREFVPFENANSISFSDGDRRLQLLRHLLSTFSNIRSEQQKEFHDAFTVACLPHIYGVDWEANRVRVLEQFNMKKLRSEVMCITPRRFGKSWAVAMFCAALLLVAPNIRICVFSTGKRASGSLMELVLKFIAKVPGAMQRVCKKTEEQLFIANTAMAAGVSTASSAAKDKQSDESTAKLFSFPSSVKGKQNKKTQTHNTTTIYMNWAG